MNSDSPNALDRALIDLLAKKIAATRSRSDLRADNLDGVLQAAGVPAFVWESVLTSCAAATATTEVAVNSTASRKVTIVGGRGEMGRWFADRLRYWGHGVQLMGRKDWDRAETLLGEADLVLISVPIDRTVEIIREAAPYLKPDTVLADITSIKGPIVAAMLEAHPGPVLGLHPMFGPGVTSFLSQKVVVCPGREMPECQWFIDFIANDGGETIECPPEEHDRMMVAVQALRHFATFGLGVFLGLENVDIGRSLDFASPIYRVAIDMVSRLFAQDGALYVEIMLATPERRAAIARLAETFVSLSELVQQENKAELMAQFDRTRATFGNETDRALEESDRLINALSIILAAQT